MSGTTSPEPADLAGTADLAADIGEWPEWVVDEVDEQTVIHARDQCRPGCRAQTALTDLLGRVRKRGGEET